MPFLRLFFSWVSRIFTTLVCIYTLVAYFLGYSLWISHWLVGFILLLLPVAMVACGAVAIRLLFRKPKRAIFPLVVLVLGYPFLRRTFAWHTDEEVVVSKSLKVLSYNVMFFDIDAVSDDVKTSANAKAMIKWIRTFGSDIICFQEFYNWEGQKRFKDFNTVAQLQQAGYKYKIFAQNRPPYKKESEGFVGLAITSRYPLIFRREFLFSNMANGCLVADVVTPGDTIRLLNVHLQSMGIRVRRILSQADYEHAKRETKGILALLKYGFKHRIEETKQLEKLIEESPHPVIICGDFNEVPYGYVYGSMKKYLNNAFEDAGNGFGFTYNRSPGLIRIDNQFYDPKSLSVSKFETHLVKFSDHYPTSAVYTFK